MTTKHKHTPGPWTAYYCAGDLHVAAPDGRWVADCSVDPSHVGSDAVSAREWSANARLIAASPDLLTALEGARAEARRVVHHTAVDDRLYRIDRILTAAIAKATGINEQ